MKYSEVGFRPLYHNFCYVPFVDSTRKMVETYPGYSDAEGVLVYGYIDRECGMTLEVLACAKNVGEGEYAFAQGSEDMRAIIRIGAVKDVEFVYLADGDDAIGEDFADKLEMIKSYDADEEVEASRFFEFLDEFRNELYPDDVMVLIIKEGLQPEGCWVRIIGLQDSCIIGSLLNEPNQDFGYHEGDTVAFFVYEDDKGNKHLVSDMNPSVRITEEDLEDGSVLKNAITIFNRERTRDHFIDVMEILRDSYVWIPCNAIISEEDQKRLEELLDSADGDVDLLVGQSFSNQDNVRLVPDILKNGESLFFPVFSSVDDMGEYGDNFSKVQKHFLDAIKMARASEKEPVGIVINAFSEPMIIEQEIYEVIEKMKSRL